MRKILRAVDALDVMFVIVVVGALWLVQENSTLRDQIAAQATRLEDVKLLLSIEKDDGKIRAEEVHQLRCEVDHLNASVSQNSKSCVWGDRPMDGDSLDSIAPQEPVAECSKTPDANGIDERSKQLIDQCKSVAAESTTPLPAAIPVVAAVMRADDRDKTWSGPVYDNGRLYNPFDCWHSPLAR